MHRELLAAADLLTRLLRIPSNNSQPFLSTLVSILSSRYTSHWHPTLHSAHRAITLFPGRIDPVITAALDQCAISADPIRRNLKETELIVWVDPGEVAYRMGERGAVITVYRENEPWTPKKATPPMSKKHSQSPPAAHNSPPSQPLFSKSRAQKSPTSRTSRITNWTKVAMDAELQQQTARSIYLPRVSGSLSEAGLMPPISRAPVLVTAP